ncbi:alkaline phosphatase family protein [Myxococcota bacterium]|nr:alkaline phosphatase family protein [Myxococcota bacterium]
MLHEKMLERLRRDHRRDGFTHPAYGAHSIAELVPTVQALLGVEPGRATFPAEVSERWRGVKRVVVLVVDGLAWSHLAKYHARGPAFERIVQRGDVHPITSVFPSTTPAALTTLHSGLTPQEHGLPEWTVFFEEIDAIIETLPFRVLASGGRDTLLQAGGASEMLYEGPTVYQHLARAGVRSWVFNYFEYATSAYSRATQKGANVVPYTNVSDLLGRARKVLHEEPAGYLFLYWGNIDGVMHKYGPNTPEHLAELDFFVEALERELFAKLTKEDARETLFVMTADHGQVNVEKERIIYLNRYLPLEAYYQRSKGSAQAIVPTGGPHDVFLFISPSRVEETVRFLSHELQGKARVLRTEEAIASGLFGTGTPSPKLLRRVGNVLVLPRRGHHVWYEHSPTHPFKQLGCHGGLSEEEMVVPLALASLEDLVGAS